MIVAMVAVAVVQFAIAEIIEVIAVGNAFVALRLVIAGAGDRRAGCGIGIANGDDMLIIVVAMAIMQVAIMEIIDVALV